LTVVDGVIKCLYSVGVAVRTHEHSCAGRGADCIGAKAIV
jgi:hypothetical protein